MPSTPDRRRFLTTLALAALPARADELVTPETDQAVERALVKLAAGRQRSGAFGELTPYQSNVAITSLAGLAFLASGHQPNAGAHAEAVRGALRFVLGSRDAATGLLHNPDSPKQAAMYDHGFATLFLAECFGAIADRTLNDRLQETLRSAVTLILASQNKEGGWRYEPQSVQADVSVTACQMVALRAARNAGLVVPKETIDKAVAYVRRCRTPDGGFSYYAGQGEAGYARTAGAVVALHAAGIYAGPDVIEGVRYLVTHRPTPARGRPDGRDLHYYYGHYYAAQALWTAGGKDWAEGYAALRDELLARARLRPDGLWTDPTLGNQYATAMACLILKIPDDALPILHK